MIFLENFIFFRVDGKIISNFFHINYFKVLKFGVDTYVDIMTTKEELQTEVYRLTELLRDSKKELESETAELGKVEGEKAVYLLG